MSSDTSSLSGPGDVPTVVVRDTGGRQLLCFLEQLIPLDGHDYALLTPVDTPVCLFRLSDEADPEPIETLEASEPILSVADVVLQEHDLTLVRSAVTLTVSGELDEPDPEELDDDEEADEETETFFTTEQVLLERTADLAIPVVEGLPLGHEPGNAALPLGVRARLDGSNGTLELLV